MYGLKSTADGKGEGIPVVVFGGDHADVPLEPDAGAFVAETVAGLSQSCILDFEYFSKGKQVRFLAAFFETLYDRNRDPLLLLLDEAQRYAPQKPIDPDAAKCLGAVEDIVKLGRKHGIGPTLFTQRGSGLNKEVSELCDMMVAFRTPGPLDQDRVKGWLEANTTKAQMIEVMGSLSGLPTGTAVFASGHPDLRVFGTYAVRRRETFDSSATPKVGQRKVEPKRLAKPDLEALRTKMAAAIERAKADDPGELRKVIAALRAELKGAQKAAPLPRVEIETVEKAVLKDGQLDRAERMVNALGLVSDKVSALLVELKNVTTPLASAISAVSSTRVDGTAVRAGVRLNEAPPAAEARRVVNPRDRHDPARTTDGLSGPQQRMLDALAWLDSVGAPTAKWSVLAFLSGQSPKSSGFEKNVSTLRSSGLIAGNGKTQGFELTSTGVPWANRPTSPASSEELHRAIYDKISAPQERMLRALIEVYPRNLTWDELAHRGEQSSLSSGFEKNVSTLKSYGLIDGGRGTGFVALGHLFLEQAVR